MPKVVLRESVLRKENNKVMQTTISRSVHALLVTVLACSAFSNRIYADDPSAFYEPIEREIEGWSVKIDPELLTESNRKTGEAALESLANHLQRVKYILTDDRVAQLQKLPIWIDWEHRLGTMQYHPDRGWLIANKHDPRLVKHVHIPQARQLFDALLALLWRDQ